MEFEAARFRYQWITKTVFFRPFIASFLVENRFPAANDLPASPDISSCGQKVSEVRGVNRCG